MPCLYLLTAVRLIRVIPAVIFKITQVIPRYADVVPALGVCGQALVSVCNGRQTGGFTQTM